MGSRAKYLGGKIKDYRFNLLHIFLFIGTIYSLEWLLFYVIDHKIKLQFENYTSASHLFIPLLLSIPRFINKEIANKLFIPFFTLFFLYTFSSALYFRTYGQFIPLQSIFYVQNLDGLSASILGSIRAYDILYILPILFVILNHKFIKKRSKDESKKFRLWIFLSVAIPCLIFGTTKWREDIYNSYIAQGSDNSFYYDQFRAAKKHGILPLWLWELNQPSEIVLNDNTIKRFESINIHTNEVAITNPSSPNIIILIVESLESWVINSRYKGIEITPNLNKLVNDSTTRYYSNMRDQTSWGRSSDAQLMINTGLLPIQNGTVCFDYYDVEFPSLMDALKQKNYNSSIFCAGTETFWNYKSFAIAQGFDNVYSQKDFSPEEKDIYELGIKDDVFLSKTADKLATKKEPFLAEVVTVTSHAPFKIPEDIHPNIFGADNRNTNYVHAINYTDSALGIFIDKLKLNGLYNNSLIVITGDHSAVLPKDSVEYKLIEESDSTNSLYFQKRTIPFIIKNAGYSGEYKERCYQMDIYATLRGTLVSNYYYKGLGRNLFSEDSLKEVNQKFLYDMSDSLIRGDFFGKRKVGEEI